jgi:hypothetical protein
MALAADFVPTCGDLTQYNSSTPAGIREVMVEAVIVQYRPMIAAGGWSNRCRGRKAQVGTKKNMFGARDPRRRITGPERPVEYS